MNNIIYNLSKVLIFFILFIVVIISAEEELHDNNFGKLMKRKSQNFSGCPQE